MSAYESLLLVLFLFFLSVDNRTLVTYLDSPICPVMMPHCEQESPMALWRGGYVYSTVWKHI